MGGSLRWNPTFSGRFIGSDRKIGNAELDGEISGGESKDTLQGRTKRFILQNRIATFQTVITGMGA